MTNKIKTIPTVRVASRQAMSLKLRPLVLMSGLLVLYPAIFLDAAPAHAAQAQQKVLSPPETASTSAPHRTRLILKDGGYQVIMSYRVVGGIVHYVSAERGGAEEEIPANLVDFEATRRWDKQHSQPVEGDNSPSTGIDPALLKEEADRASFTPLVAPDLHLPEQYGVLALDTFQSIPELVPLAQTAGDLNRDTGHSIVKGIINPQSSSHAIVTLRREASPVQLHVADPVIYLRIGNEVAPPSGSTPITVDTHGATGDAGTPAGGSPDSQYVIVRSDIRTDARVIASFRLDTLGSGHRQEDVTETITQPMPGGHWMKITPRQPLSFGEYVLMEILSGREVNLGVWDFGVHPVAPENRDALKPEPKRPLTLDRHRPE